MMDMIRIFHAETGEESQLGTEPVTFEVFLKHPPGIRL